VSKFSYKTLLIIFLSLLISIVVLWKFVLPKQSVKATWWNDSWNYRQAINISSHTSLESNVYIITTVNIGTTAKAQTDDGDFRFIDQSGQNLDYYIASGIGTTNLTFHILIPSFPVGAQTIYVYYGNTTATNGFSSSDFTTQATNYTIGSLSTEEVGGGPIAYWKFDEGVGSTAFDSNGNNNAFFGVGSSAPTWASENQCLSGKCLYFNGSNSIIINNAQVFNSTAYTVSAWVKINSSSNNQYLISFANNGLPQMELSHGTYPILYLNNGANDYYRYGNKNIKDDNWHFVQFIFDDSINNVKIYIDGKDTTGTGPNGNEATITSIWKIGLGVNGYLDEFKIYPYARTANQIKLDYNSRGSSKGTTSNLGIKSSTAPSLSSKLVAHYKFDEGNGNTVYNSSGNNYSGTITGSVWSPIKSGIGLSFDGSNDYITLSSSPLDNSTIWSITTKLKYLNKSKTFEFFLGKNDNGTTGKILLRYNGYISFRGTNGTYYNFSTTSDEINNLDSTLSFVSNGTTIKLYVNGSYKSTITPVSTSLSLNIIGNAWNDTVWQSVFLLDELKIYNSALTDDEVKQDYNQGSAISFGSTNQTIGGTTTDLNYCIPGDTSFCASPVAEWNFEENTGTVAKDTSGKNNNGTFGVGNSVPTWTTGKIGSALNFNGTTSALPLNSTINLGNTDWTFSSWVKTSSSGINSIISNSSGGPVGSDLRVENSKMKYLHYNGIWITETGNKNISDGKWHYLTWVNHSNQTIDMYVDGIGDTFSVPSTLTSNGPVNQIGRNWFQSANASIDQVRIYNYARTPAQVAYDYNKGAPVGWWKLDECQGLTAFDASGLGNNGTINIGTSGTQTSIGTCNTSGTAWSNGASGHTNSSLNFDGTDDYININDSNSLDITKAITISVWVKPFISTAQYERIVSKTRTGAYAFGIQSGNKALFTANIGEIGQVPIVANTTIPNNVWTHLLVTYDGSIIKYYFNGQSDGTAIPSPTGDIGTNNSNLTIGSEGLSTFFPGQIDDVRIYNYALTSEQIKQVYNGGAVNFN